MNILNLYAGVGGNRKLWVGHSVTAVENNNQIANVYKKQFPEDDVLITDAHQYLLDHYKEYDFIWSSPPCQRHSRMNKATRHESCVRYVDGKLFEEIIFLQHHFKGKWIVENVIPYYEPYGNPKKIGRHLYWSNFPVPDFEDPKPPKNFINLATVETKKIMMDWLGIHYEENIYYGGNHCPVQILRNCVHPLTGLHILNQLK